MTPKGVLEIPECPGAVDGVQKIFANPVGLYEYEKSCMIAHS